MFVLLVGQQIGLSDILQYTVHDTEFIDSFTCDDRDGTVYERFTKFLDGFYEVYVRHDQNPIPSLIRLMSHYGSRKHSEFFEFFKSKGFEKDDYEKYMVLI